MLNPRTAAEAWNVIRLSTSNVARLLQEDRLAEVPDQISLCSPALRALAALPDQKIASESVKAAISVSSLAQASVTGDKVFARSTFENLRSTLSQMAAAYDPKITNCDIYFCPMHPDFCSPDAKTLCEKCGMSLVQRRIPYSFVYVPPGEPSIQIQATADKPLAAGSESHVRILLTKRDGSPVLPEDLTVMHTQRIHLLVIDPALEDYHHEHPVSTGTPGEYAFSFTPATSQSYRIFADLTPAENGVQEYTFCDLAGTSASKPATTHDSTFTSSSGGFRFQLTIGDSNATPVRAQQVSALQVSVSDAQGQPVAKLEPVMNAFAHLVGFYDDYRTVVHLHPAGPEILNPESRGGASLDFKFYPPKAGFLRLYCQVVIDGKTIFAPFNVNIAP
ncbi:MAG: hypothetical protein ABIT76_06390 [Chthoniobacterales bacterium]